MEVPLSQRPIMAKVEARYRDQASPAYQAMLVWGMINCVLVIAQQYLNFIFNPIGAQKFTYVSTGLWVAAILATRRAPLRIPLAMAAILIMQIWLTICSVRGQLVLATLTPTNAMDFLWLVYVVGFFQASMLVWFAPQVRRTLGLLLLTMCCVSAGIAYLQFLNIGPAISISQVIRAADIVFTGAEGTEEIIRAPGLHSQIGGAVVWGCAAAMMWACRIYFKGLRWYDVLVVSMLIGSAVLVQVRNQMVLVSIIALWIVGIAVKKYGPKAAAATGGLFTVGIGAVLANPENFGYLLKAGTGTLDYRRERLWPQAVNVLNQQPIFGIGVEPAFCGWTTQVFPNKWLSISLVDNGFYLIGIWGGWPAIAMLGMVLAISTVSSIHMLYQKHEDYWHAGFRYATAVIALFMLTGMVWGGLYANPVATGFYFIVIGLAMPSYRSDGLPGYDSLRLNPTTNVH